MIEYHPKNFFIAHWFVDQPSPEYRAESGVPNMNWIAAMWRCSDGRYHMAMRFAYFDDQERRERARWQAFESGPGFNVKEAVERLDQIALITSIRNGNCLWERVDLNLPGDQAFEILIQKPWMRVVAQYGTHELN